MDEKIKTHKVKPDLVHNVIMENRTKITISGVENAESYNETEIILHTSKGILQIKGIGLNLNKLSIDSGEITIGGKIYSLEYLEQKEKVSFLSKLFR